MKIKGHIFLAAAIVIPFATFLQYFSTYGSKANIYKNTPASQFHYWNQAYINDHTELLTALREFHNNNLCYDLKTIIKNNERLPLSHQNLMHNLEDLGYHCSTASLRVTSDPNDNNYLKKDGSITQNADDIDNALQTTCVHERCSVRIKPNGLPNSYRKYPHVTFAILYKEHNPSYQNELGKISHDGNMLPPGPNKEQGIAECPYGYKEKCKEWIDNIMDEVHIPLYE